MAVAQAERQRAYKERQQATDPVAWQKRRSAVKQRWADNNREKRRAHYAVDNALRRGQLVRPQECGRCHVECKPEASHDDYSKRLEVEWLCGPCHRAKDGRN